MVISHSKAQNQILTSVLFLEAILLGRRRSIRAQAQGQAPAATTATT
jgi:hypothetical protein